MAIIKHSDFNKARKSIREAKEKPVVFSSEDDELNRKVIEKENIDILLINLAGRKDYMKQRNSGFNQVMAKAAKEKGVKIGINLDEIVEANSIAKPRILARLEQNIFLCNKNNLKMKFVVQKDKNKRELRDLKSLGLVLGMPTWMTKDTEIVFKSA
ncbi:MAG: RNase P subunit p30 family protein [Candidatus Pacearchaeota archaeon]